MIEDEEFLLALLNSAPVIAGKPTDSLLDPAGPEFAMRFGGTGSEAETARLRQIRDCLQNAIRGTANAAEQLESMLNETAMVPKVTDCGLRWELRAPADQKLAARAVVAWSHILNELPGRLKACANDECNLFLLDRSRPGTAKWCSMATCGNRSKARAHQERRRGAPAS